MRNFNYEKIYMAAHGNPTRLLTLFAASTSGPNFIVNPRELANAFWVPDRLKAEYLGLCSLRSYEQFLYNGTVDLPLLELPPWVPLKVVKENPLVTVTNTHIIFNKEK